MLSEREFNLIILCMMYNKTFQVTNISACLLGSANCRQEETISNVFDKKYSLIYLTPEFCDGETGSGKYF